MTDKKRRCAVCRKLTQKWHRINGGVWFCYDGCQSTTGMDFRIVNGWLERIAKKLKTVKHASTTA